MSSTPMRRKRGQTDGNSSEEFVHNMADTSPEHDMYKSSKNSGTCSKIMAFLVGTMKFIFMLAVILGLLAMIVSLTNERDRLKSQMVELREEYEAKERKVLSDQSRNEDYLRLQQELTAELTATIDQQKNGLAVKQEELQQALADAQTIRADLQSKNAQINQLSTDIATANQQVQNLNNEKSNLLAKIGEVEQALNARIEMVNQLSADLQASRASEQNLRVAAENSANTEELDKARADVQSLTNENLKQREQINQLSIQVNDNAQIANNLQQQVGNLENERNALVQERNTLSQDAQAKDAVIKQLQDTVAGLEKDKQALQAQPPPAQ